MAWRNLGRVKGDTGDTGAQGPQGPQGSQGPQGAQGPAGEGVPTGGTPGQVLKKYADRDYASYWADSYEVPTDGNIGQVLKKYGSNPNQYRWDDESGGGTTPVISATASVDNTSGVPAVSVTKSGTDAAPNFNFAFTGLKGQSGEGKELYYNEVAVVAPADLPDDSYGKALMSIKGTERIVDFTKTVASKIANNMQSKDYTQNSKVVNPLMWRMDNGELQGIGYPSGTVDYTPYSSFETSAQFTVPPHAVLENNQLTMYDSNNSQTSILLINYDQQTASTFSGYITLTDYEINPESTIPIFDTQAHATAWIASGCTVWTGLINVPEEYEYEVVVGSYVDNGSLVEFMFEYDDSTSTWSYTESTVLPTYDDLVATISLNDTLPTTHGVVANVSVANASYVIKNLNPEDGKEIQAFIKFGGTNTMKGDGIWIERTDRFITNLTGIFYNGVFYGVNLPLIYMKTTGLTTPLYMNFVRLDGA